MYLEVAFSQKASSSFPQSLWQRPFCKAHFHVLDLFLQPVCFWSHAADEAKGFVPSWSDLRYGRASSAARLRTWPGQARQGIPVSSCHRQATRLQYRPSLFCTYRGWAAAMAASPQASHLLGSWDQPQGQIQP